jgi:hypothetical protein
VVEGDGLEVDRGLGHRREGAKSHDGFVRVFSGLGWVIVRHSMCRCVDA